MTPRPLVLFLIFVVAVSSTSAQSRTFEDDVLTLMQNHQAVGLSVAVVKEGKIVYTKAFGLKDTQTNEPLQEGNLFRIASISKSFSATAIMQLVEAKMLSLDDDFGKLVGFPVRNPKFPDKVITLRMALSHTSSMNDSQGYFTLDVINPEKNPEWAKCFNDYAPGEAYEYCNLNYNMVGAIIEKITGERFDEYVKNHVLMPMELNGGYCVDSLDNTQFTSLYEYDSVSGFILSPSAYASRSEQLLNYKMGYTTPVFSPTGGMKISAPDLARYMIMHMNFGKYENTRIMSRKSSKTMQKPVAEQEGYALGLMTTGRLIEGKRMTGHTGSAYGLYSSMFFQPKEKFGFVVITNGCKPSYTDGFISLLKETINHLYNHFIPDTSTPTTPPPASSSRHYLNTNTLTH